jgi:hypothetical protein
MQDEFLCVAACLQQVSEVYKALIAETMHDRQVECTIVI